ncbi:hypothetical protein SAMN04488691_1108 [Haloferax larsenii]|uniref:DUF8054 domain-containing protein n=1 Tax=Haloferax larsenii TaxID=302484 RepID=A0A1H7TQ03_HALLR|nr:hypothetical protein SAMN04488691_1108 [Haloferax larsenii]
MNVKFVEKLGQPEYTGENRCEPCTALNLIIAMFSTSQSILS